MKQPRILKAILSFICKVNFKIYNDEKIIVFYRDYSFFLYHSSVPGVSSGLNAASLGGSNYGLGNLGARTSFHIGGLVEIPIMGKFYIIKGLTVEFGPQIGFLVSGKSKYDNSFGKDEFDIIDNYKSIDVSLGVGASYRLNNGVFFSLRFNKGISNINDSDTFYLDTDGETLENFGGNDKQYNNVFQISAGYSF